VVSDNIFRLSVRGRIIDLVEHVLVVSRVTPSSDASSAIAEAVIHTLPPGKDKAASKGRLQGTEGRKGHSLRRWLSKAISPATGTGEVTDMGRALYEVLSMIARENSLYQDQDNYWITKNSPDNSDLLRGRVGMVRPQYTER